MCFMRPSVNSLWAKSILSQDHKHNCTTQNCKWWSNEEDEDRIECWAFCDYGLSSLKASGNHLLPMMAGPSSCRIEESGLITGPMSLDESTFSDLPVLVGSRLGDLDRDMLEPELLLSVPVITLNDSNDSNITQQSGPDSVCSLDLNCAGEIDIVELSEQEEAIIEETVEEEEVKDEPVSSPQAPDVTQEPSVFEAQTLFDLGSGTYAYLHDQPQDGCQVLKMDDGRVAYITVIPPLAKEQGQLKVEESPKKTKSFMCTHEGCGRLYTSAHHLKVHERTHSGTKPYMCTIEACGKAFSTDYSRKAHIRTHTGEKPYQCLHQDCNKGFKTSGDLQKHIRTHTGERPFICSVEGCNRSFTTSNIRKVHLRTHTGERPYICKEANCDKAFASATNYKNHIRIHSGEKPYACSVLGCNRKFTEYSSLYKHAMVHTQEKPYGCAVCGRSYRQASTLTVHKRSVHGVIETDDGTELVLGKLLTHRMLKRAAMLSDSAAVRSQENDEFMLDSEGPFQRTRRNKSLLSSEQIFIIEDMPEQYAALQHIQDPDDEELKAALGPLKEEEL